MIVPVFQGRLPGTREMFAPIIRERFSNRSTVAVPLENKTRPYRTYDTASGKSV